MSVSLRQLRAFASVGRLGSFTKAADALHMTQPALSARIRELEEALGVRLFDRSTRSVVVTSTARDLLPVVDQILSEISGVVARARDVASRNVGTVTIAALPSVSSTMLPRAIARFRVRYPGITVTPRDALAERIVDMIRSDQVDFGITSARTGDAQLDFFPLATDHMVAVLARGHPLARAKRLDLSGLLTGPLILMDRDSSVRRIVDNAYAAEGLIATPAFEATYMSTAIGMVRGRLGVTLLPSSALELRGASDVVLRRMPHPLLERKLGILRRRDRSLTPAAEAFVELLRTFAVEWFRASELAVPRPRGNSSTRRRPARPRKAR